VLFHHVPSTTIDQLLIVGSERHLLGDHVLHGSHVTDQPYRQIVRVAGLVLAPLLQEFMCDLYDFFVGLFDALLKFADL